MPIIAKVGRRSVRGRLVIYFVYVSLILGAITTVYPFWLMLAGSVASNHTAMEFRLVPRYLYDERGLFEAQIFSKYYRYSGIEDIEWQWKVDVPGTYGKENVWTQVPGARPGPGAAVERIIQVYFCTDPFDAFSADYIAVGAPQMWTGGFATTVKKHYPFAVDAVREFVEQTSSFKLQRHDFTKVLRGAFSEYLGRFTVDYDAADRPPPQTDAYDRVMDNYPLLRDNYHFNGVMRAYALCRKPDLQDPHVLQRIKDYNAFRAALPLSLRDSYWIGSSSRLFEGDDQYQAMVLDKYKTIEAINEVYETESDSYVQVYAPYDKLHSRSKYIEPTQINRDWLEWKSQMDPRFVRPAASEFWWGRFLDRQYDGDVTKLNKAYGTSHLRFFDAGLGETMPATEPARSDWQKYVRTGLATRFMHFVGGHDLWRDYLLNRVGSLEEINQKLRRNWSSADQIKLPVLQGKALDNPPTKLENDLILDFVATTLPLEYLRVHTPEYLYRASLLETYSSLEAINKAHGLNAQQLTDIYFPMQELDWLETRDNKWHVRSYTFTRAYSVAINHIFRHTRSLWNTFVFCTAVVLAALVINPLCAYALSRFNLPGAYKILLFLMATMAFPAEVTMIPNFLLLKTFPLMHILCCLGGFFIGGGLAMIFSPSKRMVWPLACAGIGALLGATIIPESIRYMFSTDGSVSLLNTYWALILPGVASGYSIFILKGFFDSLPQELYESAVIDGAGEFRIFSQITLPMSTPVLAVIALWSFTAAYGSFTWALIICQDERMWTLMVHLFQYQMMVDYPERLAALVLASIPTLFVFLIIQKVILKGIILPTYK